MDGNSTVTRAEFDELRRRVERHDERLNSGDTALALINQRLDSIDRSLTELAATQKALSEKPAKRWDAVVSSALQWAVTALLAYLVLK